MLGYHTTSSQHVCGNKSGFISSSRSDQHWWSAEYGQNELNWVYLRGRSPGRNQCALHTDVQPIAGRLRKHSWAGLKDLKAVSQQTKTKVRHRTLSTNSCPLWIWKTSLNLLTLWHLSNAWRVSCSRLTTNSGDRKVSPWVSMMGPRERLVRCLIRSFSSWML